MIIRYKIIIVAAILLFTVEMYGCGYRVTHIMASNEVYSPKPDSYDIIVFNEAPNKKYIKIAHIYAFPRNSGDVSSTSPDKAINALKDRAKELGADALIVTSIHMAPSGTWGQGGFSGEGDAIRWVNK
jgi:hypothetical protein